MSVKGKFLDFFNREKWKSTDRNYLVSDLNFRATHYKPNIFNTLGIYRNNIYEIVLKPEISFTPVMILILTFRSDGWKLPFKVQKQKRVPCPLIESAEKGSIYFSKLWLCSIYFSIFFCLTFGEIWYTVIHFHLRQSLEF